MRPDATEEGPKTRVPCVPTAGNDRLGAVVEEAVARRPIYMEIGQPELGLAVSGEGGYL